jgi:putative phosphoesterase
VDGSVGGFQLLILERTLNIAVLSDVHGNLPALEEVLNDLQEFSPNRIIVAGDLTGGPFNNEVIEILRGMDACMVLGNSDLNLLRYVRGDAPIEWRTRKQFGLLRWNSENISGENLQYLSELPEERSFEIPGLDAIRVVHGAPSDPYQSIYPDIDLDTLDQSLGMIPEPVLICGHTHRPWFIQRDKKMALNPGSVAGPLNGEIGAQYARLFCVDNRWNVEHITISYDLAQLKKAFEVSGLLEKGGAVARGFLLSMENGHDATLMFLEYAYGLARQAGFESAEILPDEIWELASETFDWDMD